MSFPPHEDFLSSIHILLLDSTRATILASQIQFGADLRPSQHATLVALGEVDVELRALLRCIVLPQTHPSPAAAFLASLLRGCSCTVSLVDRQLRLYHSTYSARGYVTAWWAQVIEALQQYRRILRRVRGLYDPNRSNRRFDGLPLSAEVESQNSAVQQLLEDQIQFEASHWDEIYQSQHAADMRPEYPPSVYVTSPSSIKDGDTPGDPPTPPQQSQPTEPHSAFSAEALQEAREQERSRIYAILKSIWISKSESPQKRSSCLVRAIRAKCADGVSLLADLGVEVNQPCDKDLPLSLAASLGHDDILRILIERGATVDKRSVSGSTALMSAAGAGHTSTIELLLANKAGINAQSTSKSANGFTPLMEAVKAGHQHACGLLISRGADAKLQSHAGESLLHIAIQNGRTEIINLVLNSHPQIGVADKNGNTELHLATTQGLVDVSTTLLQRMNSIVRIANHKKETPLHYAIRNRSYELSKLFLEEGAFVDTPDNKGRTPLHYAVEKDCLNIVHLLLDREADVDFRDCSGKTPLHYAMELANVDVIQALLQKGPILDIEDKSNETPLHYAVKSGNHSILRLCIAHGVSPRCKVTSDQSLLEYIIELSSSDEQVSLAMLRELIRLHKVGQPLTATFEFPALSQMTRQGKISLAKLFCKHDPKVVNETPPADSGFLPPLHEAIKSGHKEMIDFLCHLPQTDLNILDHQGNTPLHQAVLKWQDGLPSMLIARGADKDRPHATSGLPPLHFAVKKQYLKVVEEFIKNKTNADQRVDGPQCDWCRKHSRPAGMNSRCVLQAIPEARRKPEWEAINTILTQVLNPRPSPGPGSVSSGSGPRRRAAR